MQGKVLVVKERNYMLPNPLAVLVSTSYKIKENPAFFFLETHS